MNMDKVLFTTGEFDWTVWFTLLTGGVVLMLALLLSVAAAWRKGRRGFAAGLTWVWAALVFATLYALPEWPARDLVAVGAAAVALGLLVYVRRRPRPA
jgi:hypothetical protein